MWLMKFKIPMYFMTLSFSYSRTMLSTKIVVVIIGGTGTDKISNYLFFYNNISNSEFFCFCRNKYGGVQVSNSPRGSIYNRSPLKNLYTSYYYTTKNFIHISYLFIIKNSIFFIIIISSTYIQINSPFKNIYTILYSLSTSLTHLLATKYLSFP